MTLRNIDALFKARPGLVLGAPRSTAQHTLLANMQASVAHDRLNHITARPARARLPGGTIELGVILDAAWARPRIITALAQSGCKALFWAAEDDIAADVLRAARPYNLRLLGNHSAGIVDTRGGLNTSTLALAPRPGHVALITQSESLAAAALDWALGRNVGFSWLACSGGESDIDAADLLDYAALDPRTRAVVLQIGRIQSPRKFMSAARAAARVKPVLVLQTRHALTTGPQGPDPVRSAAFARAGLVECENLGGLFDGLVALELLPAVANDQTIVVGNGAGACALGTDALIRQGLEPARVNATACAELAQHLPHWRATGMAIDLGDADIEATLAALRIVAEQDDADAVLFVHSPVAGQPHEPMVEALANSNTKARLMTVWLGLYTARAARDASARARLATFASADDAVRAIHYRARHRYTRELLTATPPPDPSVTADVDALRKRLETLAANGVEWLSAEDGAYLLTAYGMAADDGAARRARLRIRAEPHPELGMVMSVTDESVGVTPVHGFCPLDGILARRMLEQASASRLRTDEASLSAFAQALVRIGRMITDLSQIVSLDVALAVGDRARVYALADSLIEITARPAAPDQRLALTPYPARMRHRVTLGGAREYSVRPVRPSDEPAVLDLMDSLSAEEIRLRFFSAIRHFSHDMAARLTQVDYDREIALVASAMASPDRLAGMATLIADPDKDEAEFALLVHHDHARIGLGRHLLDCLLRHAHTEAVQTVYGHVLAHNASMRELAKRMGFHARSSTLNTDCVRVEIAVGEYLHRSAVASS